MDEQHEPTPLVRRLMALQERAGMNDAAFARDVLWISKSGWSMLRRGNRDGSGRFVERALAILADPASFLPSDVQIGRDDRERVEALA